MILIIIINSTIKIVNLRLIINNIRISEKVGYSAECATGSFTQKPRTWTRNLFINVIYFEEENVKKSFFLS